MALPNNWDKGYVPLGESFEEEILPLQHLRRVSDLEGQFLQVPGGTVPQRLPFR